jgi:hypothetical protein
VTDDLEGDVDALEAAAAAREPVERVSGERAPHLKARATITPDGVEVSDVPSDVELSGNLDPVLEFFGLDPAVFVVVDDTVRIGKWQQSKRLESGDRDVVWLWSYSARFQKVPARLTADDEAAIREYVRSWAPVAPFRAQYSDAVPSAFVVLLADWQYGKGREQTAAALTGYLMGMLGSTVRRIGELRAAGRRITEIVLVNMGDPTEGCDGNYAQQTASTITQRAQLRGVMDLWVEFVRQVAPLAPRVVFVSVLCNHGEWMRRNGSKTNITDDSDNVGGYLADELARYFEDRPDYGHVEFVVPHDEMTVLVDVGGVPCAFAHGHKMSGSGEEGERKWLLAQSIRLLRVHGREPEVWFTAHRHHDDEKDFGPWTRHQACSADAAGSKWLEDLKGVWSTPGTTTMLVGRHVEAGGRGWSDKQIL